MAALEQLQNLSNQTISTVQGAQQAQKEGLAKIKADQGYDTRLKAVEDLRRSTYDTEKVLSQLPADIQNRTRGRLVTNAQQNRITSKEKEPLALTLANLARSQDVEQQGVGMVRGMLDDFLRESMTDTEAKLKALGLQREDAKTALGLEQSERDKEFQRQMAELNAANQRTLSSMNQPSYDLSFLKTLIDSKRKPEPAPNTQAINTGKKIVQDIGAGISNSPLLKSLGKFLNF
jgi:hypothetical protein